jgi:hypothetical protein
LAGLVFLVASTWAAASWSDQVETVTGDRYFGRVVSLGNDTLVLQSEILGTVKLPRSRIATISLGSSAPAQTTNSARVAPDLSRSNLSRSNVTLRIAQPASTNVNQQFDVAMRQLGTNSSVISQVQDQLLAGAGPEAQGKFNELVSGLLSGKVGVNELRAQAKTTLDQARAAQKELGDEGGSMESYLAILEGFLKETSPAVVPSTNSASGTNPLRELIQNPKDDE